DYTEKFTQAFLDDMRRLNLEPPEQTVRATDHIDDMVSLIQRLQEKTFTYQSDGSIYFSIKKFPGYGRLSKIDLGGIQPGARVDIDRYEKADARDFALWKARKPGEHFWDTPLGPGRPGWHIECSAMSMKYLGETIDIHTGGVDLAFPHHENEIAQSEAATGKPFVRFWLHAEHLIVEGEKMSKSLGNFFTLRDLLAKGHKPSAIRYLLAAVPYRRQLNFTFAGLQQAESSIKRLRQLGWVLRQTRFPEGSTPAIAERAARFSREFLAALDDDLNTAEALAAVHTLVTDCNTAIQQSAFCAGDVPVVEEALQQFNAIFAVLPPELRGELSASLDLSGDLSIPGISDAEVEKLIAERAQARARRDFKRSDEIRDQLAAQGIVLEDTKDGVRWKRA
ncbi:MAG: cysteine--tRNA ligase, partial [Candidatus Acidiferrales bacterium]